MQLLRSLSALFLCTLVFGHCAVDDAKKTAQVDQLAELKKLVGDWSGVMKHGSEDMEFRVNFRVSSGGSVVIETINSGTEHEMTTIYQKAGDGIQLTHYCMLGNQPKMRAKPSSAGGKLTFEFDGGTNLDPQKDKHMHAMTLEFLSADRIKETWTLFEDGKAGDPKPIELKRTK